MQRGSISWPQYPQADQSSSRPASGPPSQPVSHSHSRRTSRSGLALHYGVTVLNTPGTLDADYRGEVHVILANFGAEPFAIERGARIAQLVFVPTVQVNIHEVASLE
jgi:deoxyuridine 5'-triphosphate nucleotidohydrolase